MSASPYDQVAYRTFPRRQTHPDRLAAVARLFGMDAAPVDRCRVLEIGCGTGGNLIPLAYHLPDSRFTGVDLAATPIAIACETAAALELTNVELRVLDLREIREGEFDYIFAHGVYSWVPADVREALLALCAARLAPKGVAFVSYNAYPGAYPRRMIREILLQATAGIGDPAERMAEARRFLAELPHDEARSLLEQGDDILFHDILAPVSDAFWFHEFAADAGRHGLQFLGEADLHEMFDPRPVSRDGILEREQYLDLLKVRRFRQTLLCREEVRLVRDPGAERMNEFLFSENPHGHRIPGDDPAVEGVAQALRDVMPLPVQFAELIPYAGGVEALREILFSLMIAGCVDLHVYDFPCQEDVTERPRASRLALYQAARGENPTNACHIPVALDDGTRDLLLRLDGTFAPGKRLRGKVEFLARMALLE